MKKESYKTLRFSVCMLGAFFLWTLAVRYVDVQPVGPKGTAVGFARMNQLIHDLTGVHFTLYAITDWLGLVPLGCVLGFALLGLTQWIQRKHLGKIDDSILLLGGFYILVMLAYLLFEVLVVNYRPVLIDGHLEASYPSSTTMLVMCVMPAAVMEFRTRIKNEVLKRYAISIIKAFILFMIICRLISGVHWFSDIIGGVLLSAALVGFYRAGVLLKAGV